jgi:hypothetical protein
MYVLRLTLGKIFSTHFSLSFYLFSVKHLDGLSLRPDGCRSVSWTVRLHVWMHAAFPHVDEAMRVPTGLMNRPDGDPTAFIKPGRRISKATPQFSHLFWLLASFCIFSPSFVLLCITHYIPGTFSS